MASKCASKTLFVGNLHASLEENDLLDIFRPFGRIVECCKRWCHYGFIQFATEDEARLAFNNLNGSKVRGRPMRIEFQRKKVRSDAFAYKFKIVFFAKLTLKKNADILDVKENLRKMFNYISNSSRELQHQIIDIKHGF
jgi:RNA recognition motif-containing protein